MKAKTKNNPSGVTSSSPSFSKNGGRHDFFASCEKVTDSFFAPNTLQPKLKIGQPSDKYEQEADHVADSVMRMTDPLLQRQPLEEEEELHMKRKEPRIQKKAGNYEDSLQTKPAAHSSGAVLARPQISRRLQSDTESGSLLPADIQREMNSKIGADFSNVNIHTGSESHQMNQQLGAKAFTHGGDIYFNKGQYNPQSNDGKHLLTHELTHVVQQGLGGNYVIQKQGEEESVPSPDPEEDNFEFDYELLPPALKFSLGNWMLQANTGSTELEFSRNLMRYSFGYNYGGSIFAGLESPAFSSQLGVDPASGETSLNVRHDQFRFGGSISPGSGVFGVNVGYGAPLLPMPSALSESVYGGWTGTSSVLSGLGSMQDPISFYQSHSNDIDAVMNTVRMLQPLAGEESGRFGAGLRFTYNPSTGVLFSGGMQWRF